MYLTKTFFGIIYPDNLNGSHYDPHEMKIILFIFLFLILIGMFLFIRKPANRIKSK